MIILIKTNCCIRLQNLQYFFNWLSYFENRISSKKHLRSFPNTTLVFFLPRQKKSTPSFSAGNLNRIRSKFPALKKELICYAIWDLEKVFQNIKKLWEAGVYWGGIVDLYAMVEI